MRATGPRPDLRVEHYNMAGIPNPFVSAFQSLRTWLTPFFGWALQTSSTVNALVGTNTWVPVNLLTVGVLSPTNTYNGTTKRLTATTTGALTVDGVVVTSGMRLWLNNEATGSHRGLYKVINPGSAAVNGLSASAYVLERAADADTSGEYVQNKIFAVTQGATKANTLQKFVTSPFTLDTTTPVITDITGSGTASAGAGDMLLGTVQTVTAAKTFNTATLLLRNAADTFSTTFTTLATAARAVVFPDGAGTVLLDALAQTVSGVKKFTASSLGVWNSGATFASLFTTNATADRTLVLPDSAGHVMLTETNDNISGTKTFADGKFVQNNAGATFGSTLHSTATADRSVTLPDAAGTVLLAGSVTQYTFTGLAAPGAVTLTGAKVGQKVIMNFGIGGSGLENGITEFETTISVADQIQQTSATDLSTTPFVALIATV